MKWSEVRKIVEEIESKGGKVTRTEKRRLRNQNRHLPVYTKKFSTERGKTKAEKKMIQVEEMRKRFEELGIWEERKWYYEPYRSQLFLQ